MAMSQARYDALKAILDEHRARTEEELRTELNREGKVDLANLSSEVDDMLSRMQRKGQKMRDVAEARGRLEQGSYGHCQDCGKEIEEERLRASIHENRCASCLVLAQEHEKRTAAREQRSIGPPRSYY